MVPHRDVAGAPDGCARKIIRWPSSDQYASMPGSVKRIFYVLRSTTVCVVRVAGGRPATTGRLMSGMIDAYASV